MSGECILVVDDSKQIVKHLTETILPTFGYRTLYAYDGRSGLELIRQEKPDLVMLDYNLPEMTGIDVLQEMVQESINTPVILMTGYGSEVSAQEAFRLGAKDYLIKPFTIDEIIETIDRALVEKRLLNDKKRLAEELRRAKVEIHRHTEEMNTFFNIGKAIASLLSVDKVLERVLEASTALTGAEESCIWLPDETGEWCNGYERKGKQTEEVVLAKKVIDQSLVGEVMATGKSSRQSAFSGQGIEIETSLFAHAILYLPLKLRGVTIGVLGVRNHKTLRSFSKRDEFLLAFLADYAAIALENARVFQAADRALAAHVEELNTLIEITRTITSSLDLDEVVHLTIRQVHSSWRIEAVSLWLLDEEDQSLRVVTNIGTPDEEILTQVAVPMGTGYVGLVAQTGKPIYTNDVTEGSVHYRDVDDVTGFTTRSLLCVPLISRGQVIGAMQLLNKASDNFDERDIERAMAIASAVAIAFANALLYQQAEMWQKFVS